MTQALRILHLTARADAGGGPEILRLLAAHASPALELFIAAPRQEPHFAAYQRLVAPDHLVELPARRLRAGPLLRLAGLVRRHQIAIVHSHGFGAGLYSRLLGLLTPARIVHSYHGFLLPGPGPLGRLARSLAEQLLAPGTDLGLACGPSELETLRRRLLLPPSALALLLNGIEPAPPPEAAALAGPLPLLAVGRLCAQKNPLLLIRIAELLRAQTPAAAFRLRIIGEGPLRPALERRLAASPAAPQIELLGAVPARPQLRPPAIYLSTALGEGLPLALLEALSAGLPAVATRVPGNVDVVEDGVNGFLFDAARPEEAAATLACLLASPAQLAALGRAARASVAERFLAARMASECEHYYRHLLGLPHAGRAAA